MLITSDVPAVTSLMLSRPGCIVAYPTETFYGLGARFDDAEGVNRIVAVKGIIAVKGMIVLVPDMATAVDIALIDHRQRALLENVWPGPVSAVLKAARKFNPLLAPGGRIALRISPHGLAAELVRQAGPVTSTSANRTGETPARTAREVSEQGMDIDAVLDGGETLGGKPSTLIDLTVWPPACLRDGAVPFREVLGLVT